MEAPPTFRIHLLGSKEAFDFTPPVSLWIDMQAFAQVFGLTMPELIARALSEQLPRMKQADESPF